MCRILLGKVETEKNEKRQEGRTKEEIRRGKKGS
jgi:hypothetical protein